MFSKVETLLLVCLNLCPITLQAHLSTYNVNKNEMVLLRNPQKVATVVGMKVSNPIGAKTEHEIHAMSTDVNKSYYNRLLTLKPFGFEPATSYANE